MPVTDTCPGPTDLRRFLLGQVTDPEAQSLQEHLAQCDACVSTLESLKVEDTLWETIRHVAPVAAAAPRNEQVEKLVERLCRLSATVSVPRLPVDTSPAPDTETARYDFLTPPQEPGELGCLGSYRVLRVLGAGGMGVVFLALDPHLQRDVALKVMRPALAANLSARRRFLREAQAMVAIEHEHIMRIYHVGEDRDVPFLVMQYLPGESLDDRLRREGRLPVAEAVRVGREIAAGLTAAHARGLIHRDIKPSNIWLEGDGGRVKILDFGLARAVCDDSHLTQTGVIVGTPAYMAPEQARNEDVDERCDLFGLGCVLYRMLTGEVPFKGTDTMSTLMALAADQPRPPAAHNPAVSGPLSDLVMRLLAKDRVDRPASAEAVLAALQATEDGTSTPAATPLRWRGRWVFLTAAAFLAGAFLLGIQLTIKTKHGTLVVNVPEAGVRVLVDGEEKVVIDSGKVGRVEIIPGPHQLVVKRGQEELYTESFTLRSGKEVVIDAKWDAKRDQPAQPTYLPRRSQQLAPGTRAMAFVFTAQRAAGGFAVPGSRVDVVHMAKQGDKVGLSKVLVQDVRVLAVDVRAQPPQARLNLGDLQATVTLEVTPEQAKELATAEATGILHMVLRPPAQDANPKRGF